MKWELLDRKDILDCDGFWTEYSLYTDGERFVCIFGDSELYRPEDGYFDMEFDDEEEAHVWFRNFGEDEEDID